MMKTCKILFIAFMQLFSLNVLAVEDADIEQIVSFSQTGQAHQASEKLTTVLTTANNGFTLNSKIQEQTDKLEERLGTEVIKSLIALNLSALVPFFDRNRTSSVSSFLSKYIVLISQDELLKELLRKEFADYLKTFFDVERYYQFSDVFTFYLSLYGSDQIIVDLLVHAVNTGSVSKPHPSFDWSFKYLLKHYPEVLENRMESKLSVPRFDLDELNPAILEFIIKNTPQSYLPTDSGGQMRDSSKFETAEVFAELFMVYKNDPSSTRGDYVVAGIKNVNFITQEHIDLMRGMVESGESFYYGSVPDFLKFWDENQNSFGQTNVGLCRFYLN